MDLTTELGHVAAWKRDMGTGLLNGRVYSDACISTYSLYTTEHINKYGRPTIASFKQALSEIPVHQFAKRLKYYEALNCYMRYLKDEGVLEESNYIEMVKKYKPKRHLPPKKVTVDAAGLAKLEAVADQPLDRFIIHFLAETGLRVTEAANLELKDIDLERRVLTIRLAKWGKSRRVGLTQKAEQAIKEYLGVRPQNTETRLFLSQKGIPLDRFGFRVRLEKLGKKAGVPVSPHALRRAFVTLNANKGRPLVMLQMACGHSDIATTRSYCLTTEDEAIQEMQTW